MSESVRLVSHKAIPTLRDRERSVIGGTKYSYIRVHTTADCKNKSISQEINNAEHEYINTFLLTYRIYAAPGYTAR